MATLVGKNLGTPDETRTFPKGKLEVVQLGDATVARGVFEPGWRWSEHVKPIVHTDSCQLKHVGYLLSGRIRVRMDDGTQTELGPGDAYVIEPGHDAWVVGDETAIGLEFAAGAEFAKPSQVS
jgi:quercetin dioxygenase-like cupin family protein